MIQIINADILSLLDIHRQKTIILHGCNCFHTMGSGIARYLRAKYPSIYIADTSQTRKGDMNKLGTFSSAVIDRNFHILNCYTQYRYGRDGYVYANYDAIKSCFATVANTYDPTWEIRMPKIGCGLAGGDWNIVEPMIHTHLKKHNVKIYYK